MGTIFDKWNSQIDTKGLQEDIAKAGEGSGDYPEIPVGKYEVKIDRMELKESSKGSPMFTAWFKIINGQYTGQRIFMNQVINQGFQIGQVNRFLKSLEALEDDEIEFKDYVQYNDLVMDVMEAVDADGLEFLLDYGQNNKGYNTFTIKEVYTK